MTDPGRRFSDDTLELFYREFQEHEKDEKEWRANFMKAFPNDDPQAHRQYHEAVMRAAEAQERFWQELRLDVAKKSFWGLIVLLCGLALTGAAVKFGVR